MKKVLLVIVFFGFFEVFLVSIVNLVEYGSSKEVGIDRFPIRRMRSIQGIEFPFHDPYNISHARKWIKFHGNIDSLYSIDELLKMHEAQNSVTITGKPAKSPLLRPKKIRIISTHFTRTDLLKIQYYSIKRFVQDTEWEFYVVNTAFQSDSEYFQESFVLEKDIRNRIRSVTETFDSSKVTHVFAPEKEIASYIDSRTDPASRCANVMQWCLDNLVWGYDGYVIFLDADAFFYDDINIGQLFVDHDIVVGGRNNYRVLDGKKYDFVTNNLLMLDPERLPNQREFRFGRIINEDVDIDAGAETYHYFTKYPQIHRDWFIIYQTVLEYPLNIANNIDHLDPAVQRFFLEDQRRYFGRESYFTHITEELNSVHYKRGSNWDKRSKKWQIGRGRFWMEFWTQFFGCDDDKCSNIGDRKDYKQLRHENIMLRRELENLKKKNGCEKPIN